MNFSKSIIIFEKQNIEYMVDIFSEALEKAHTREGILGSISESKQDFLEKGKRAQVGEIREWRSQKFQKQPNGGWLPVKGEKKSEKKEEKPVEKKDKKEDLSYDKDWEINFDMVRDVIGDEYTNSQIKEVLDNLKAQGCIESELDIPKDHRYSPDSASDYTWDKVNELLMDMGPDVDREKAKDILYGLITTKSFYEYKEPEVKEEKVEKKEEIEMPSEKDFFRATGLRYNHPVEDYQVSLAILNEVPDDHKMWTGKTAGEMKELLTKQITKLGGSIDVGTMKDWFVDE